MADRLPQSPRWTAWMGWILGVAAWGLHHQIGSNLNYANCQTGFAATLGAGLPSLAVALAGAFISFQAWRRTGGGPEDRQEASARFVALLATAAGAFFSLIIIVQIGAGLVVPVCWR